jgi:hypothetical protein
MRVCGASNTVTIRKKVVLIYAPTPVALAAFRVEDARQV